MPPERSSVSSTTFCGNISCGNITLTYKSGFPILTSNENKFLSKNIVFSDKTLQDMTEKMPTDKISMLEVSGVAQLKFAIYGQQFLDEISGFMRDQELDEYVMS